MSGPESMRTIICGRIRQSFMKDDELSDVTFIVGPGKFRVPGHKTLLAFCSPVFQAQFYGPLSRVNNKEGQGPTVVEIPDMEPKTFINFMSFLYRDELTDGNKGTAQDYLDLLYPAHKYLVPALNRLCVQELREKIQLDNVFQVCESAVLYGELELKNSSLQYMNKMSKKIIKMPQFLNLDPSMLSVFLESDGLAASEQEIHRAVLRWGEAKLHRDGDQNSRESIRNALGDLIYLIRFPTMSGKEFSQEERVSALRTDEILEIYRQIGCEDTASASKFGTKKRRLDCKIYVARCCSCSDEPLESLHVRYAQESPYKFIQFKIRTDTRIFLMGLSVCSILRSCAFPDDSVDFQVGLALQVGDLPSVSNVVQIDGDAVEAENKKNRRRSRRGARFFSAYLDEPSEVPANSVVAICVEVFETPDPRMNMQTHLKPIRDLECPYKKQVQVDCDVDNREVNLEFLTPSELGIYSNEQLPGIIFIL